MLSDKWPLHYDVRIDSSPYYGAGDGYFHPSTHPMMGELQLYKTFHPATRDKLVPEPNSLQRQMAFAMGSALHGVLQTQMKMCKLITDEDIEVEYVNHEHHVRGRIDWMANHPNGQRMVVEMKALDCATPILTTRGWSTMGNLRDGDEVYAPDGQPTKVVQAHPIRVGRPCYEVRFRDGQRVVADEDHLWQVHDRWNGGSERVMSTKEIVESKGQNRYRFRVPVTEALWGPQVDLPLNPWLLGMWLGDGSTRDPDLTTGERDLSYLCERLVELGVGHQVFRYGTKAPRVTLRGLMPAFRQLNLMWLEAGRRKGRKFIPEQYMLASEQQRRQLLAGLMDADGTVGPHQAQICMVNESLMRQVLQLVRSLGYRATWNETRAKIDGADKGPVYWVKFSTGWGESPFDMPRKREAFESRSRAAQTKSNSIVAVVPVESRPTRCITVAHESSLYLVGEGFVPTHNTRTAHKFAWQAEPEPSWIAQLNLGLDSQDCDLGVLLMVESGYPYRMTEFQVHRDHELLNRIYSKFDRVRAAIAANEEPAPCCGPGDKQIIDKCPARFQCWRAP